MAKKIPLKRIGVQRDGVTVYPEVGKAFDFSKEELADLDNLTKETKVEYYRDPVNEDSGEETTAAPAAAAKKKKTNETL